MRPEHEGVQHDADDADVSADTTCDRVSQVRSGSSLCPVNQARPDRPRPRRPTSTTVQTGLHSPVRVMSLTRS